MSLQSDHKALLFIGAVALLGAGVRIARANGRHDAAAQPALEHQMQAADSSKRVLVGRRRGKKPVPVAPPPSAGRIAGVASVGVAGSPGATNDRAHVNGRLDLDVASAAQIDSLPGVGPSLARKIVLDRMARGPFASLRGLERVKGMNAKTVQRLDSLVTFSGVIVPPNPADTAIVPRGSSRAPRSPFRQREGAGDSSSNPRLGARQHAERQSSDRQDSDRRLGRKLSPCLLARTSS